ncbi:uncharacterized protein LOC120421523 [Culex pipiens pallens]|uniref:uncharacterized protein LOC120421523 n=1 Tax=Culex pipiens pallens TaxID=42434 RepID=UPI0019540BF4|nr:uncharacterized protein LOC120421523 [Culex pipiens pallens]
MSFDTTNTNSGCKGGVITLLPKMLNKELLPLACRHHVAELTLKHCYELKGDVSQSDKLDNFKIFREKFNSKLESCEEIIYRNVLHVPDLAKLTQPWRQSMLDFCLNCLNAKQPRGDYVELLELVILFLGGDTKIGIKFRRAGSISRARWMARAIYVLKIWMVNIDIKNIDQKLMDHFEKLALFITKCYVKYWYSLNDAIKAPRVDLEFWRTISSFDFPEYAETAARSFEKHLWYLSPRLIALAMFDDLVTHEEKRELKQAYLKAVDSDCALNRKKMKVDVPTRATKISLTDSLASFVTADTKDFFKIMTISTDFMLKNVQDWEGDEGYIVGKKRAASLQVTNDVAERGVKLISDFNQKATRDPAQQEYMLQVIESHRQRYPKKW